jgi:Reverse transcriptase (RNA-dependent DNA polymerase)
MIIKKFYVESADVKSYRPISNLSLYRSCLRGSSRCRSSIIYIQWTSFLRCSLLTSRTIRPRPAVLKVLSDILVAVDDGDAASLVLLDLSAAFDTVYHDIPLRRLQLSYGFEGLALRWFRTYLTSRTKCFRSGSIRSAVTAVLGGPRQGSVLGPILFVLYTTGLIQLIIKRGLHPHLHAIDSQIDLSSSISM